MCTILHLNYRPLSKQLTAFLATSTSCLSLLSTPYILKTQTLTLSSFTAPLICAILALLIALRKQSALWCYWFLSTISLSPIFIGHFWIHLTTLILLPFLIFSATGWQNAINLIFLAATLWYQSKDATILGALLYTSLIISFTYALPIKLRIARETTEKHLATLKKQEAIQAQIQEDIAQELHDVIAREISTIILRASGALNQPPQNTQQALRECEEHARLALNELRRLVGALRTQRDIGAVPLLPSANANPATSFKDAVELLTEEGFHVDTQIVGDLSSLPSGVIPTFVKIIDELSFNALKYALKNEKITLHITLDKHTCTINSRNRYEEQKDAGTGHGLLRLEERINALRGSVAYGQSGNTWYINIEIPLDKR